MKRFFSNRTIKILLFKFNEENDKILSTCDDLLLNQIWRWDAILCDKWRKYMFSDFLHKNYLNIPPTTCRSCVNIRYNIKRAFYGIHFLCNLPEFFKFIFLSWSFLDILLPLKFLNFNRYLRSDIYSYIYISPKRYMR